MNIQLGRLAERIILAVGVALLVGWVGIVGGGLTDVWPIEEVVDL